MYKTCMFCSRPLGENRVIEEFPIGRRLAFDSDRGRLWVVCPRCERWNLTPLEERWEAVEGCERLFRGTRLRVSTQNVGLARHPEGLELVRIGKPLRDEFAAWRYGDQFGRRRRKALIYGVGGAALIAGSAFVGPAVIGGSGMGGYWLWQTIDTIIASRTQTALHTADGEMIKLKRDHLPSVRLQPAATGGDGFRLSVFKGKKKRWFEGAEAERFASQIMPRINRGGGRKKAVQYAVKEIELKGHPEAFLSGLVRDMPARWRRGGSGLITKLPAHTRLALEMALHEEEERRALEGELWRLERAWEAAEEIAAISDDLFLPSSTDEFLARHKEGEPGEEPDPDG